MPDPGTASSPFLASIRWEAQRGSRGVLLEALGLRAHHLLCMFGFRGLGYSPAFVENMRRVVALAFSDDAVMVELTDGCDAICWACPHRRDGECAAPGSKAGRVRVRDRLVLSGLGLAAGARLDSLSLRSLVVEKITPSELPAICAGCEWLPLGYCTEGLRGARNTSPPEEAT